MFLRQFTLLSRDLKKIKKQNSAVHKFKEVQLRFRFFADDACKNTTLFMSKTTLYMFFI